MRPSAAPSLPYLLLLALLCLCGCATTYEDLSEMAGVTITLGHAPVTTRTDELDVSIANVTELAILYGDEFRLEILAGDEWQTVGTLGASHRVGYPVIPGEIRSHAFPIGEVLENPAAGSYRLGVPFEASPMALPEAPVGTVLDATIVPAAEGTRITRHVAYAYFEMAP